MLVVVIDDALWDVHEKRHEKVHRMIGSYGGLSCTAVHQRTLMVVLVSCFRPNRIFVPEEQGNAPQCGQADQCVNDTADYAGRATADKGNQVKLEKTDQTPVDPADDGQDQSNFIKHRKPSLFQVTKRGIVSQYLRVLCLYFVQKRENYARFEKRAAKVA